MVTAIGFLSRLSLRRPWSHICRPYSGNSFGRGSIYYFTSSSSSAGVTRESLVRRYAEAGLYSELVKHDLFLRKSQSELENLDRDFYRIYTLVIENLINSTWDTKRSEPNLKSCAELVELLDVNKSTRLLRGALVDLASNLVDKMGCSKSKTYFFSRKNIEENYGEFENFGRSLYKVIWRGASHSAYPKCGYHSNYWLYHLLPVRYAIFSSLGVKASAQEVEEVECFCIADEHTGWRLVEMLASCAEFYRMLEIPFRVVGLERGALRDELVKFVVEGWFPASETYEELASCAMYKVSEIQYFTEKRKDGFHENVRMIKCLFAGMDRTIGCMLENHQREDGIVIPSRLAQYMKGESFLPFRT